MTVQNPMFTYIATRDHRLMRKDEPLARSALDPRLDDLRHARRRWLALVCHGSHNPAFRWCTTRFEAHRRGWCCRPA